MDVVMLLFPGLTQLDLTGPFEVLARFSELKLHLAWKDLEPVRDWHGFALMPTTTFAEAPQADILFVPGGPGQLALMDDIETLDFVRRQGEGARYVTSTCTGSLVLGAAGLLRGYRATCHWRSLQQLELLGATPVAERVVVDNNRVTGAGVTAGIDMALTLGAELFGRERAEAVQLGMEYDPHPPFDAGSPTTARPETVAAILEATAAKQEARAEAARRAFSRLES